MRALEVEATSFQLAIQPGMRPIANITVNISSGMPIARSRMPE